MNHLLLYCRPGFEKECAAEIRDVAEAEGIYGYCKLEDNSGYVLYITHEPDAALRLVDEADFSKLIFARQWVACLPVVDEISADDRISPLLEKVAELPPCQSVMVEPADTTDGREMQRFCNSFSSAFSQKLRRSKLLADANPYRLHIFALTGTCFYLGVAPVENSAPWPMGIMRLKFPNAAPSRSTLKLEEAWHWFVPPHEWQHYISGGLKAADLGAAPGGWTWQLVKQNMFVTAVDNGPMAESLMESGQVTHKPEDAFTFQPAKNLDWMVCDIVDKPARVTDLMIRWLVNGWCRETVFNLKLPMKQRYTEVRSCLAMIETALEEAGLKYRMAAKHLYHDREEITCHIRIL